MEKLYLNDLLHFSKEEYESIKIKFNQSNGQDNPMELYQDNPDIVNNQWLFWRNKQRYFKVGQIAVCLLKLSYDTWLLTTVKRVTKELDVYGGINYEGEELEIILNRNKRDWIAALENQKAVYLITDKENGKMYVGSATSDYGMLLQRWRSYITTGHGGKKHYKLDFLAITVTKGKFLIIQKDIRLSLKRVYNLMSFCI